MRISDWSSDVCSSDLIATNRVQAATSEGAGGADLAKAPRELVELLRQKQYGVVNDYPYLIHTAEMQRAPTTPVSGRWTIRLWLAFDGENDFASRHRTAVRRDGKHAVSPC